MDAHADRGEAEPLTHRQTLLIVLGVLLPTFMGSLDQTILATRAADDRPRLRRRAQPAVADHRLPARLDGDHPALRQDRRHPRPRFTLRIAILTYMAGSLVCALAPNMLVLIFGRVLHGLGGGGLSSMGMIVLGDLVSPKERGRYYGYFAATYTHRRRLRTFARRTDRRPSALVGHLLDQHPDGASGAGDHDLAAAPLAALRPAASAWTSSARR